MNTGRKRNMNLKTRSGKSSPKRKFEYLLKIAATMAVIINPRSNSNGSKLPVKPSQMKKPIT
jgi:hypothetical protein